MAYKLSPSSLSLMKECPRCFWIQLKKGIRRPSGAFPSLPGGMDRILKEHFDSFMKKGELPPELEGIQGISLFDDEELLKIWRNNRKGIEWKDSNGNLIMGAVDNILRKGEKLVVLDYKTRGYPLKEDTATHYQDQLDIYNFLLRKNGYMTEDYSYLIFYHPDKVNADGSVIFSSDIVKMDISIKNAEKIISKALEILSSSMPPSGDSCCFCEWAQKTK